MGQGVEDKNEESGGKGVWKGWGGGGEGGGVGDFNVNLCAGQPERQHKGLASCCGGVLV